LYQPASSVFVEESKNRDALRSAVTAQARRSLTAGNDLVIPAAVDGDYFAVSFLSVQDHSGEHAGYLVTYERTRAYRNLNINTAERIAIVTLGFVLAAVIIILTAKARYQAEAANRTKSQFLANVSHDLRTPLNGIMGMISTLENPDMAPDKRQEYLRLLRSSTNALFHLLDSLLEISRIEADRVEIDPYPVDLSQFASDLCQEMRATELSRGLELRLHINEDVPRYVSVDESRLRRVLFNCIHNGLKFTNEGGVSVYVTVHKSEARTAWIQFQVVDTGIGIPQDQLETVFEKFSQADNSYSRLYGGTGLGLSIVKAITELMGGTVEVHSVLGVGTTIRVVMPMEISDQQSVHIQQQVEHGMSPGFRRVKRGFRVLLVEDDRIGRIVGSELLKQQDWDVDLAEDGQVALTKASPGGYDLILMDWRMPNMDGAEATRRLLEIWEERGIHPAPIIGLTVSDSPSDRETLRAVGMSGFLSKPLQMAALSELVADFFADTPIDLDVAESSFESADEMVGEILPIFLAQAEDRLKAIRSSMETDDYEQAARQTHPLKTAARYIGAHRLGELAARLDAWVSKRENLDAEEFQQTIAKLQKELARIAEWADERRGRKLPKTS
jgi:signal transduction histidine kinase/DNA-binding NarL/FixJ family response regulator